MSHFRNIMPINKLKESLNQLYDGERRKILHSVEESIKRNDPRGLEQSIGRRNGFFWESMVKQVINQLKKEQTQGMIMFSEFVDLFVNNYIDDNKLDENCSKHARAIVKKFFEVSGTEKQDLCDFVFIESEDKKYAIDTKWRFISNDSKTVRQIAFSAIQLKALGFTPVLLIKRPRSESLKSPIDRFEKSGWVIKSDESSLSFIKESTGFDLKEWIEDKVNVWNDLSKYHPELIRFNKSESNFKF